jgi:hypothetical protein
MDVGFMGACASSNPPIRSYGMTDGSNNSETPRTASTVEASTGTCHVLRFERESLEKVWRDLQSTDKSVSAEFDNCRPTRHKRSYTHDSAGTNAAVVTERADCTYSAKLKEDARKGARRAEPGSARNFIRRVT